MQGHAPWNRFVSLGTRLTFVMQYFLNRAALDHVDRYIRCAMQIGVQWHLVVHEDDGDLQHIMAWQHKVAALGRNATLVISQNVHELRGYNMAARMRDASLVIFLQDDEDPPATCDWLGNTLAAFARDRRLGAVGLRRGATNGDWDDEVKVRGRQSLGTSDLCDEVLQTPARYVLAADLAPLAVRREAFMQVGGFPTFLTPEGVPGIGMDTLLCILLWRAGWSVLLMPQQFEWAAAAARQVQGTGDSRRNTVINGTTREMQYGRTTRYIKVTHLYNRTDDWKTRTLRQIHLMNEARFRPCPRHHARHAPVD